MFLQNKNLYDPIMYLLDKLKKKESKGGIEDYIPSLEADEPLDLIRVKGRLVKVDAVTYYVDLIYNTKGQLDRAVGATKDGNYTITTQLIYDKGILIRVVPTEVFADQQAPDDIIL